MNHEGKARRAALRILAIGFSGLAIVLGTAGWALGAAAGYFILVGIIGLLFGIFTVYFFRDPTARPPGAPGLLLAPAHGKVDLIDETEEPLVMKGRCRRVSIFLSVFDVHVQQSPVSGKISYLRHTSGKFLNALSADSALYNENVLIGVELDGERSVTIGVRLIAGLIARRILPWISLGENIVRGQRISMIQFGSRCDLYFPMNYEVKVRNGDRVIGGETVIAARI